MSPSALFGGPFDVLCGHLGDIPAEHRRLRKVELVGGGMNWVVVAGAKDIEAGSLEAQ
jgi:hypothetical protein